MTRPAQWKVLLIASSAGGRCARSDLQHRAQRGGDSGRLRDPMHRTRPLSASLIKCGAVYRFQHRRSPGCSQLTAASTQAVSDGGVNFAEALHRVLLPGSASALICRHPATVPLASVKKTVMV